MFAERADGNDTGVQASRRRARVLFARRADGTKRDRPPGGERVGRPGTPRPDRAWAGRGTSCQPGSARAAALYEHGHDVVLRRRRRRGEELRDRYVGPPPEMDRAVADRLAKRRGDERDVVAAQEADPAVAHAHAGHRGRPEWIGRTRMSCSFGELTSGRTPTTKAPSLLSSSGRRCMTVKIQERDRAPSKHHGPGRMARLARA
jgi:hypothetical protein